MFRPNLRLVLGMLAVGGLVILLTVVLSQVGLIRFGFKQAVHPSAVTTLQSIQRVGELTSLRVRVEKVVDAESSLGFADFLFGDRLLLLSVGEVAYGFDFSSLTEDRIQVSRTGEVDRITLNLPDIAVLSVALDEEETRIYDRQVGWLRLRQDRDLESLAREAAVRAINTEVETQQDYLALATQNAEAVLESLLKSLGFEEISFE